MVKIVAWSKYINIIVDPETYRLLLHVPANNLWWCSLERSDETILAFQKQLQLYGKENYSNPEVGRMIP